MSKMLSGIGHVKEDDFDYETFINKNKKTKTKLQLTNRFHLLSICVVRVDE
jgi:hypothetical protein